MTELHDKARRMAETHSHNMIGEVIRDLLAENERIEHSLKIQAAAARNLHRAERALMSADRDAAEKARKLTDPAALESLREANSILTGENEAMRDRAEAAEARLRALCEQEPVRYEFDWFDPGLERYDENWGELRPRHGQTMQQKVADIESYQRLDGKGQMYRVRRLIPRPSMEECTNG